MICPALAAALEADRERLNALFAQARRAAPELDGQLFLDLFRRCADPLLAALPADSSHSRELAGTLYVVLLELYRKGFLGPQECYPQWETHWRNLMTSLLSVSRSPPQELVAPFSNALLQMAATKGCRTQDWVTVMERVARFRPDARQLRQAGQVAAWLCGMAAFREQALVIARDLPEPLVNSLLQSCLGDCATGAGMLDRLARHPWPAARHPSLAGGLHVLAQVGGFRGLGGEFRRPPTVLAANGQLHVTDGVHFWVLLADAFGSQLHRIPRLPSAAAQDGPFQISTSGQVKGPRYRATFAWLSGPSSQASTDTTLAVTLPHSHRVFLLGEVVP